MFIPMWMIAVACLFAGFTISVIGIALIIIFNEKGI